MRHVDDTYDLSCIRDMKMLIKILYKNNHDNNNGKVKQSAVHGRKEARIVIK